nr:MAG TPA: hypothetical protein [Caudoviricetes sp.]
MFNIQILTGWNGQLTIFWHTSYCLFIFSIYHLTTICGNFYYIIKNTMSK